MKQRKERFGCWLSKEAKEKLKDLANRKNLSEGNLIENLILKAK